MGIVVVAYLKSVGSVIGDFVLSDFASDPYELKKRVQESPFFCPDVALAASMKKLLTAVMQEGDSLGGVVEAIAYGVPPGWGDPTYEKLSAKLAAAMLSIPAAKAFELGEGINASFMKGSLHNDTFTSRSGHITPSTNHAGGLLGGISTGQPILLRTTFKPTSSIKKDQPTVDFSGAPHTLSLPEGSRHDPCLAIRAVPVVEAMFALTLVDAFLCDRF